MDYHRMKRQISILEKNQDKIYWEYLSHNLNAITILINFDFDVYHNRQKENESKTNKS